jgi:predicted histidine transporter YuiF (NhaC family)
MSGESSNAERLDLLVTQAAGAVATTGKKIGYRQAMELVGFAADEITNNALYKRVTRRAKAMMACPPDASVSTPVHVVCILPNASSVSTLTAGTIIPVIATPEVPVAIPPLVTVLVTEKKQRRTVKELNRFHSNQNAAKEKQKVAMKAATTRIKRS